jgi:hypothetical protein
VSAGHPQITLTALRAILAQFGTGGAGAGADGYGVHCGGCEDRKRRGIGIVLQLASLTCSAEARFKIGVDRTESRCETVPDLRIFDGFGYRGPDHKAAVRAAITRKINDNAAS